MTENSYQFLSKTSRDRNLAFVIAIVLLVVLGWGSNYLERTSAQSVSAVSSSPVFRIGEKLTYSISYGKIPNAGYAETHVFSRGKLSGKDAVEIRSKVKTLDLVSAAFLLFDESRTVFAAPDTGLPLYVSTNSNERAIPKETINNYLTKPTSNFDLLTLIFRAREAGGIGTFPLVEAEQFYTVSFQGSVSEKVKTDAGEFDTTLSTVQSDFLASAGIKEVKINFSSDEHRVPVLIRLKTLRGEFRIALSAIVLPEPEAPTPSPTPASSPKPTPTPSPMPPSYIDNLPLSSELGFQLGEVLDYRVTNGDKPVGQLTLNARERKLFEKADSLLLTATISGVEAGTDDLRLGESATVQVDPETLAPTRLETKFSSPLTGLRQTVTFDRRSGGISFDGKTTIDAPIGTHSFLSLIYAMRSFNLKPSKDPANPVNDTRVAVFWDSRPYVFTLRPSNPEEITINGEKRAAQLITIKTLNKELDALSIKVWLSSDSRVPLRFSAGTYQADLISQTSNLF